MDCDSTQTIFFPTKSMKFISIKGTKNTYVGGEDDEEEGDHFHIVKILATLDTTDSEKTNSGMSIW